MWFRKQFAIDPQTGMIGYIYFDSKDRLWQNCPLLDCRKYQLVQRYDSDGFELGMSLEFNYDSIEAEEVDELATEEE